MPGWFPGEAMRGKLCLGQKKTKITKTYCLNEGNNGGLSYFNEWARAEVWCTEALRNLWLAPLKRHGAVSKSRNLGQFQLPVCLSDPAWLSSFDKVLLCLGV